MSKRKNDRVQDEAAPEEFDNMIRTTVQITRTAQSYPHMITIPLLPDEQVAPARPEPTRDRHKPGEDKVDPAVLALSFAGLNARAMDQMRRANFFTAFRIDYQHRDRGRCTQWAGTKGEAAERKRALKLQARDKASGIDARSITVATVEVPTNRPHLLNWLNELTAHKD